MLIPRMRDWRWFMVESGVRDHKKEAVASVTIILVLLRPKTLSCFSGRGKITRTTPWCWAALDGGYLEKSPKQSMKALKREPAPNRDLAIREVTPFPRRTDRFESLGREVRSLLSQFTLRPHGDQLLSPTARFWVFCA